jgi:hypothetical protein
MTIPLYLYRIASKKKIGKARSYILKILGIELINFKIK